MKIRLITISKSKGIVLPQAHRQGWEKLFKTESQAEEGEDRGILVLQNKWDEEE